MREREKEKSGREVAFLIASTFQLFCNPTPKTKYTLIYILSVYIYFSITQFAPHRSSIVSLPLGLLLPLKLVYIYIYI